MAILSILLLALLHLAPAVSDRLIFLLAGQSNMSGRGGVSNRRRWDGLVPPECSPSPSVLRLTAGDRWEEARDPLHADIDLGKTCGVGPGMSFANAVVARVGGEVGLVPCAVGGTRIRKWVKGRADYGRLVERATAAGKGGRVAALLWYQGESDTLKRRDAEAYGWRMEQLIGDLRSDLGLPNLLVIQVALASGEGNFTDIVREAQQGIKLPNVACVDAKGLELESDHLHLTTNAQVQLGKMLAAAYFTQTSSANRFRPG